MSQEALEKTSGILPEAWYDLIARLVPGAFASILTFKNITIPKGLLEGLLVGLIVFYITGFFLEVFAELVTSLRRILLGKSVNGIEFWVARNKLRPSQWQAVSKMSAESNMFRSLSAYFFLQILLFLLHSLYVANPGLFGLFKAASYFPRFRILPLEVSILMGATCLWYMAKLYEGAQDRLKSYEHINSSR
jgi:hypothetical protein